MLLWYSGKIKSVFPRILRNLLMQFSWFYTHGSLSVLVILSKRGCSCLHSPCSPLESSKFSHLPNSQGPSRRLSAPMTPLPWSSSWASRVAHFPLLWASRPELPAYTPSSFQLGLIFTSFYWHFFWISFPHNLHLFSLYQMTTSVSHTDFWILLLEFSSNNKVPRTYLHLSNSTSFQDWIDQQHISLSLCLAVLPSNPQLIRDLLLLPGVARFDHFSTAATLLTFFRLTFYPFQHTDFRWVHFIMHQLVQQNPMQCFPMQQACQTPKIQTHKAWSQSLLLSDCLTEVQLSCKVHSHTVMTALINNTVVCKLLQWMIKGVA